MFVDREVGDDVGQMHDELGGDVDLVGRGGIGGPDLGTATGKQKCCVDIEARIACPVQSLQAQAKHASEWFTAPSQRLHQRKGQVQSCL